MFREVDYYGDRHRWFLGRVVNNKDPLQMGRVQIFIEGIHSPAESDIPQWQLPWAITASPTTEGGTSGIGRIAQIQPGAMVYGIFLDGEISQLPLVIGVLNQYEIPSKVQRINSARSGSDINVARDISNNAAVVSQSTRAASQASDVNTKRWSVMNFFVKDNGYTLAQAAGICGNLEAESGLRSGAINENDAGVGNDSKGLAQWNRERLERLINFAGLQNKDWKSFDTQLLYIDHELRGRPLPGSSSDNDGASKYSSVYTKLTQTTTYYGGPESNNATWIFCSLYEVPANARQKLPQREEYAAAAYNTYTQTIASS